jgi:hypothetical protein
MNDAPSRTVASQINVASGSPTAIFSLRWVRAMLVCVVKIQKQAACMIEWIAISEICPATSDARKTGGIKGPTNIPARA